MSLCAIATQVFVQSFIQKFHSEPALCLAKGWWTRWIDVVAVYMKGGDGRLVGDVPGAMSSHVGSSYLVWV